MGIRTVVGTGNLKLTVTLTDLEIVGNDQYWCRFGQDPLIWSQRRYWNDV